MDFAKDFLVGLRDRVGTERNAPGTPGFDWSGLHARLVAAHAARAELVRSDSRPALFDGAFTDWAAAGLAKAKDKCAVNPADSTDGKAPHAITGAEAGQDMAGGRGQ